MRKFLALVLASATLSLSGCGYNTFQRTDEQVKAAWSQVLNQYQWRADLVPNLVNTVKGVAGFEQETLLAVTHARAGATGIKATPELVNDPQAFAKFEAAQAQIEGTENRITVARNRYVQAVQAYNVAVREFPSNLTAMVFGCTVKPNFSVADEKAIAAPPPR